MNFIKGIVDGILATDVEGNSVKSKYTYDPDDQDNDSEGFNRSDLSQNRNFSNDNLYLNNSISQLGELYKNERDNCVNGLIVRYGEGCVQQLSQLLKSNHDTILSLSHQYQKNLLALNELNNKVESAATEHLKLKNENNTLSQQLNLLTSENFNLKSQLAHANITIKSNENHISSLNEVLRDNKNTFENMKNRCGEFYRFKSEIDDLKKKLNLAESHISMLKKERDDYWSDPNRVLKDEDYKKRISQALERQDRAIAVAKIMATQKPNQLKPEKDELNDLNNKQLENESVTELKLQVDKLEDENSHLKEINDSLHTMYADLNKNLKEVKNTYLRESVESLTSLLPNRVNPIQLVFIQPTGVLDLDFDPSTLHKYSYPSKTESFDQQSVQQQHSLHQHGLQQQESLYQQSLNEHNDQQQQSSYHQESLYQHGVQQHLPTDTPLSTLLSTNKFQDETHFSNVQNADKVNLHKKDDQKKTSSKMNFRSKVIQYVTGLDGSPRSSRSSKENNLLDLESPKLDSKKSDSKNYSNLEEKVSQKQVEQFRVDSLSSKDLDKVHEKVTEKVVKSTSWNTDWDIFDEEVENESMVDVTKDSKPDVVQTKVSESTVVEPKSLEPTVVESNVVQTKFQEPKVQKLQVGMANDDSFDFILEEENKLSESNVGLGSSSQTDVLNVENSSTQSLHHQESLQQPLYQQNDQQQHSLHHQESYQHGDKGESLYQHGVQQHLPTNLNPVHHTPEPNLPVSNEFSDFNTHLQFDPNEYDDLLNLINSGQESVNTKPKDSFVSQEQLNTDSNQGLSQTQDENKKGNENDNKNKAKKGWDMDFDDEMFEADI